ncbi:MAG TPA: biotin/lipoyl-containing protein, partial [Micromonosporaceae bacterium]
MPVSVTMPRLGESVTEGTVTRWLKREGDRVEVDEPLLEVSTDKVDTEIPSPAAGVLSRIVVGEDETAEVGAELAIIAGEGESAAAAPAQAAPAQAAPAQSAPAQAEQAPPSAAEVAAAAEAPASTPAAEPAPASASAPSSVGAAPTGEGTPVKMPALGESVTEGTVTRWLKQVGDRVEVDEPLLEVSTDKVDTEIPSPVAGVVLEIKVAEDEVAAVGADLAVIGAPGAAAAPAPAAQPSPPAQAAPAPAAAQPAPPAQPTPPAPSPAPVQSAAQPAQAAQRASAPAVTPAGSAAEDGGNGYVTPLVRKLAAEHGVELANLAGTGVGGRIRKQDVLAAAEGGTAAGAEQKTAAPAGPAPGVRPELAKLRGTTQKVNRIRPVIGGRRANGRRYSG